MSTQMVSVAEPVVMEVEEPVATVGQPPVVDRALIAQLVGDAQRGPVSGR